jgi:adenylosuccinate lyase
MRRNVDRYGDTLRSEQVLAGLAARIGKHEAQQVMHDVLAPGAGDVHDIVDALVTAGVATEEDRADWTSRWATGDAANMVDTVVARARRARAMEPETWP